MAEKIWDQDEFMRRIMNNEQIAEKLIALLKSQIPNTLNDLAQALKQGEAEEAGLLAHKLKGSISNLGGIQLAELAGQIEAAGRESKLEEMNRLWPEVRPQYEALLRCLDQR